ncbi:MAG: cation:proton antiporter, partial [Gammaproteobacteria bacterium]
MTDVAIRVTLAAFVHSPQQHIMIKYPDSIQLSQHEKGYFMHDIAPLIYDLAVMLGLASIVIVIFQRIKQPIVLGYLVAGMVIGPYTPPYGLVSDVENIKILSELGVIFLMFSLGLEFSFQKLTKVGFSASVIGTIEVVLMVVIGFSAGWFLGWSYYDCLFLGAALSISSTTIIIKAIEELHLKTKRFAEIIFGTLVIEDLLAILLLVALSTIVLTKNILFMGMVLATGKLILVVGSWFIIGYFMMPTIFRKIAKYVNHETLTIIAVALCLFLVCVAASLHYSTALGAFIMGSILAETHLVHRIEYLIRPIRDIFAAVFFVSIGMLIDPAIIVQNWGVVLFLAAITIFGKLLTTSMGGLLTGQSVNTSVRVGFSMAQIGEFSFIIVGLGEVLKVIDHKLYPIVVAVSGITTFTTPYLIRFSGIMGSYLETHMPEKTKYFLNSYSAWVYRTQVSSQDDPWIGSITMRLFINGLIVAIIFTLTNYYVMPRLMLFAEQTWLMNTLGLLIATLCSLPFIWGMLFFFKSTRMPNYAANRLNPIVFMAWLLTLFEVTVLGIVYFHTFITVMIFLAIASVFLGFTYRRLEKSYHWFEQQLINNIKPDEKSDAIRYAELAPWDTHLVEVEVGESAYLTNKTLKECGLREKYGINIVAILHGSRVIPAPRGKERIVGDDKLVVLGNDEQIDAFKEAIASASAIVEPKHLLSDFTLKAFLLDEGNSLVGKTIRKSKVRELFNGMVVGLERDNVRVLNPNPDMVLQPDDLLLIVGMEEKLRDADLG